MHRSEKGFKMDLQLLPGFLEPIQQVLGQIFHDGASQGAVFIVNFFKILPADFKQYGILGTLGGKTVLIGRYQGGDSDTPPL
jgi:hypothetical protein